MPSVDVDAPVISVDVDDEQRLEVPDPDRAGWYTGRALPGETGPAVIVGHVDSWDGPAVFSGLERLEGGEAVAVTLTDGRRVDFEVTEVAVHRKEDFPTEAVYGDTAEPALRLVTCGGPFLADEGQYRDNVIVFAEFTSTIRTSGGEPTQQE